MDSHDIEKLRLQLLDLQSELQDIAAASQDSGKTVMLDQSAVGRLSRMDAMQQQQMALESERRRQIQLLRITAALERIVQGHYGLCEDCDADIDPRRLTFDPTNTHCINCAD